MNDKIWKGVYSYDDHNTAVILQGYDKTCDISIGKCNLVTFASKANIAFLA